MSETHSGDIVASEYVRLLAQHDDLKASLAEARSENRQLQNKVTNGAVEAERAHALKVEQLVAAHARALADSHRVRDELEGQLKKVRAEVTRLQEELSDRTADSEAYRQQRMRQSAREVLHERGHRAAVECGASGLDPKALRCAVQVAYALLTGARVPLECRVE